MCSILYTEFNIKSFTVVNFWRTNPAELDCFSSLNCITQIFETKLNSHSKPSVQKIGVPSIGPNFLSNPQQPVGNIETCGRQTSNQDFVSHSRSSSRSSKLTSHKLRDARNLVVTFHFRLWFYN